MMDTIGQINFLPVRITVRDQKFRKDTVYMTSCVKCQGFILADVKFSVKLNLHPVCGEDFSANLAHN
jgi:hypothetical protein